MAPPPSLSTRPVTPAQACARTPMLPTPIRVPPPPLHHAAAAGPPPCPPRCTLSMVQTGVMVSSARAHHARRPLWPRARYRHFLPPPLPPPPSSSLPIQRPASRRSSRRRRPSRHGCHALPAIAAVCKRDDAREGATRSRSARAGPTPSDSVVPCTMPPFPPPSLQEESSHPPVSAPPSDLRCLSQGQPRLRPPVPGRACHSGGARKAHVWLVGRRGSVRGVRA